MHLLNNMRQLILMLQKIIMIMITWLKAHPRFPSYAVLTLDGDASVMEYQRVRHFFFSYGLHYGYDTLFSLVYQMLRNVTFDILADEPDLQSRRCVHSYTVQYYHLTVILLLLSPSRRVMFKIYDGLHWSNPAYVTVTIEPVNDNTPVVRLYAAEEVKYYPMPLC